MTSNTTRLTSSLSGGSNTFARQLRGMIGHSQPSARAFSVTNKPSKSFIISKCYLTMTNNPSK